MGKYKNLSDADLTDLLKSSDELAFKELYIRYWKKALYFANQKIADLMEAENIVQDIFVSLWNRRDRLTITSCFYKYLLVAVNYRVIKFFDKRRSHHQYKTKLTACDILDDSTQQYLDFEELRQRLEELLASFSEKSALIYRMNKEAGMSHKEIAAKLGISEKAVNAHLVRSKKALRTGLCIFSK